MKRLWSLALATVLVVLVLPSVASAQATRTWVSGVGDDVNPCSRTAPCKTFAGTIAKTAAHGEINCLDSGGFGGVTITKALTIDCHTTEGGVLVSGSSGITINIPTPGAADNVILRGLDIIGVNGGPAPGIHGVNILSARRVKIYDTTISGMSQDGIRFAPTNVGAKALFQNSTSEDNGGDGILVSPSANGARMTVRNSVVSGNACGVVATNHGESGDFTVNCGTNASGAGGSASTYVFGSLISDNDVTAGATGSTGVFTSGNLSTARISNDDIMGNINGIKAIDFSPFGGIISFGNNRINANATDGTPQATIGPVR